jgi:hypothetical protein
MGKTMRYMGNARIVSLVDHDSKGELVAIPSGAYNKQNEDILRQCTGMSLKTLFSKIIAQSSPRHSRGLSPLASRTIMQRSSSLTNTSSRLRPPSADDASYTSHILVSVPIPEDITKAVCELWVRRIEASRLWWLIDDIDFDVPNEDALFTVVRPNATV